MSSNQESNDPEAFLRRSGSFQQGGVALREPPQQPRRHTYSQSHSNLNLNSSPKSHSHPLHSHPTHPYTQPRPQLQPQRQKFPQAYPRTNPKAYQHPQVQAQTHPQLWTQQHSNQHPSGTPHSYESDIFDANDKKTSVESREVVKPTDPDVLVEQEETIETDDESYSVSRLSLAFDKFDNTNEKLKHGMQKIRYSVPSFMSRASISNKQFHKEYQRARDTNPSVSCTRWSDSLTFAVLPSKKNMKNSAKDMVTSRGRRFRQWKCPILFMCQDYSYCDTIALNDVKIPYAREPGYGSSFVYLCLPKALEECLKDASDEYTCLETKDPNLYGYGDDWWKVARNVDGRLGVIESSKRKNFVPKSLASIFARSRKGITASLVLRFYCEAIAETKAFLRRKYVRTIGVEIICGNIQEIDEVQPLPPGPKNIVTTAKFVRFPDTAQELSGMGI